jgi:hypothetical protein
MLREGLFPELKVFAPSLVVSRDEKSATTNAMIFALALSDPPTPGRSAAIDSLQFDPNLVSFVRDYAEKSGFVRVTVFYSVWQSDDTKDVYMRNAIACIGQIVERWKKHVGSFLPLVVDIELAPNCDRLAHEGDCGAFQGRNAAKYFCEGPSSWRPAYVRTAPSNAFSGAGGVQTTPFYMDLFVVTNNDRFVDVVDRTRDDALELGTGIHHSSAIGRDVLCNFASEATAIYSKMGLALVWPCVGISSTETGLCAFHVPYTEKPANKR